MKILFGIHGTTHTEIAQSEIDEFEKRNVKTVVCGYGNWGAENSGLINSFKLVIKNAIEIRNQAAEKNCDIIYLNTGLDIKTVIRDAITIFLLRRKSKTKKIVLKIHGSQNHILFARFNPLKKYVLKKTDLFLVLSAEERDNFLSVGVATNKVQVTANVIDKKLYTASPEFKQQRGIAENVTVLLFVGRFIPEKGMLDLIEACKILQKEEQDFILFCLGNGPLLTKAQELITQYGLQDNIKLVGHIPEGETRYYYANCDILILPTYHSEGFPMAVFQAVGAGKAVITTNIRAASDYFEAYENCLWVEKQNPQQLYTQIKKLKNNKALQHKMGANNLVLAEKFTAAKIVENVFDYLKKMN